MSDLTTFMTDFIAWVRALLVSAVWHASIHLSKVREVPVQSVVFEKSHLLG